MLTPEQHEAALTKALALLERVQAENALLREALRFYADEKTWATGKKGGYLMPSVAIYDEGWKARFALSAICSQCGQPWTAAACGPTHAILAAERAALATTTTETAGQAGKLAK
jgi:hypothetical protein